MVGMQLGSYRVDACTIASGVVDVSAHSESYEPTPADILGVLRFAHGLIPVRRS
jgi:hypothetical protein